MIKGKWVQSTPDTYSLYSYGIRSKWYGTVTNGDTGWRLEYPIGTWHTEYNHLQDAKRAVERQAGVITRGGLVYQRDLLDKEFAEFGAPEPPSIKEPELEDTGVLIFKRDGYPFTAIKESGSKMFTNASWVSNTQTRFTWQYIVEEYAPRCAPEDVQSVYESFQFVIV